MESYTPKELGIPFPEITAINIGFDCCPGVDTHYEFIGWFNAHTHQCSKDPCYKNICIPDKKYLFNHDDSISDVLWHEYAHVLDLYNYDIKVVSCNVRGIHQFEFSSKDAMRGWETDGHGPSWISIMKKFGKSSTRTVNQPY